VYWKDKDAVYLKIEGSGMFINKEPEGLNQKVVLRPGEYRGVSKVYAPESGDASVVLVEWGMSTEDEITAAELLINAPDGGLYYRNFIKMPDGLWRDSFGEMRLSLGELLPAEILTFKLLQSMEMPLQTVEAQV
jgi:hypothetical protein